MLTLLWTLDTLDSNPHYLEEEGGCRIPWHSISFSLGIKYLALGIAHRWAHPLWQEGVGVFGRHSWRNYCLHSVSSPNRRGLALSSTSYSRAHLWSCLCFKSQGYLWHSWKSYFYHHPTPPHHHYWHLKQMQSSIKYFTLSDKQTGSIILEKS